MQNNNKLNDDKYYEEITEDGILKVNKELEEKIKRQEEQEAKDFEIEESDENLEDEESEELKEEDELEGFAKGNKWVPYFKIETIEKRQDLLLEDGKTFNMNHDIFNPNRIIHCFISDDDMKEIQKFINESPENPKNQNEQEKHEIKEGSLYDKLIKIQQQHKTYSRQFYEFADGLQAFITAKNEDEKRVEIFDLASKFLNNNEKNYLDDLTFKFTDINQKAQFFMECLEEGMDIKLGLTPEDLVNMTTNPEYYENLKNSERDNDLDNTIEAFYKDQEKDFEKQKQRFFDVIITGFRNITNPIIFHENEKDDYKIATTVQQLYALSKTNKYMKTSMVPNNIELRDYIDRLKDGISESNNSLSRFKNRLGVKELNNKTGLEQKDVDALKKNKANIRYALEVYQRLNEIHEKRPWYFFIAHPYQNSAEKNALDTMKKVLKDQLDVEEEKLNAYVIENGVKTLRRPNGGDMLSHVLYKVDDYEAGMDREERILKTIKQNHDIINSPKEVKEVKKVQVNQEKLKESVEKTDSSKNLGVSKRVEKKDIVEKSDTEVDWTDISKDDF